MQVQAKAKFIRVAPRKSRLLVDLVRGRSIDEARRQLMMSPKLAAKPVLKVLNSAVANAQNNNNMDVSTLFVTQAFVDEGPTFYRYRPRAHGRSMPIRKRMSHITVMVGPKEEIGVQVPRLTKKQMKEAKKAKAAAKPAETTKKSTSKSKKATAKKAEAKK